MKWINGPPTSTGLWLVDCRGDYDVWRIELDADENDEGGVGPPYLRMSDNDSSEPLAGYRWPPERSFGPIPLPNGKLGLFSARVDLASLTIVSGLSGALHVAQEASGAHKASPEA